MQQQYVITFAGADRTGLVETLAELVKSHGGDCLLYTSDAADE